MEIWYYIGFSIIFLFIIGVIIWLIRDVIKEKNNPVIKKKND